MSAVIIAVSVVVLLMVMYLVFDRLTEHVRAKILRHYKLYATNFEIKTQTEALQEDKHLSDLTYTIRVFYNERWSWLLTRDQRQVMIKSEYNRVDAQQTRDVVVSLVEEIRKRSLKNIEERQYKDVVHVGNKKSCCSAGFAHDCHLGEDCKHIHERSINQEIDPNISSLAVNQSPSGLGDVMKIAQDK